MLGWSRFRTVSFSCSERFGALAVGLAHSFEQVGGVPGRVLFDNPKTVATSHLAGAAVLDPDLVRLAAHYPLLTPARPSARALPAGRQVFACGEERKVDRLATVRFASARYGPAFP